MDSKKNMDKGRNLPQRKYEEMDGLKVVLELSFFLDKRICERILNIPTEKWDLGSKDFFHWNKN